MSRTPAAVPVPSLRSALAAHGLDRPPSPGLPRRARPGPDPAAPRRARPAPVPTGRARARPRVPDIAAGNFT